MSTSSSTEGRSTLIAESVDPPCSPEKALTTDEQLAFQIALGNLLTKRVKLYTSGESTSLPQSTAHELLLSILYTLEIDPESISPEKIRGLMTETLEIRFTQGLEHLKKKTALHAQLCKQANLKTPRLQSIALKDTLQSMQRLPHLYDYRFFAHEIPVEIDYPLSHAVSDALRGIDYSIEYLKRLILEGTFLQKFEIRLCQRLLESVHKDYRHLLINLYEPVAVHALGLTLIGKNPFMLNLMSEDCLTLEKLFANLSRKALLQTLHEASVRMGKILALESPEEREYLTTTAEELYPRINHALRHKSIKGVFYALSN